ncbi:MAG: hypothetical protein KKB77_09050, partial [Bacteroidetes bacterium]|nr:hypothetical protein [Bacteroidota bacterium]
EFSSSKYADLNPLKNLVISAKKAGNNNTYFGYLDALTYWRKAQDALSKTKQQFLSSAINDVRRQISSIDSRISSFKNSGMRTTWGWVIAIGIVLSFLLSVSQCSNMMGANKRQAQIRQQAFDRMHNDLRSKGYRDPGRLTWDQVEKYGYSREKMPPAEVGSSFGTWLGYLFFGVVISVIIGNVANSMQKKSEVADLDREQSRLKRIDGELGELKENA